MAELGLYQFGPDELFLRGSQITIARDALSATGINPGAEEQLTTLLDVHSNLSDRTDQKDLTIYLEGGETERVKADIITSLQKVVEQNFTTNQRNAAEAARGLLSLLRQK